MLLNVDQEPLFNELEHTYTHKLRLSELAKPKFINFNKKQRCKTPMIGTTKNN